MTDRELCNRIRLFGVRYSSRVPYRLENSKINVFRYIHNADNETILHSYRFMPLRLLVRCHII